MKGAKRGTLMRIKVPLFFFLCSYVFALKLLLSVLLTGWIVDELSFDIWVEWIDFVGS